MIGMFVAQALLIFFTKGSSARDANVISRSEDASARTPQNLLRADEVKPHGDHSQDCVNTCVLGVSNLKHILRATMEPRAVHAIRSGSPQCRLLRVPHRVDRIQLRGVGLETDTALAASDVVAHCAVVVWSRHLVWMGLLPVHRLALADSRAPWVRGSVLIHSALGQGNRRYRSDACRANALALGTLIVVGALTAFLNLRDLRRHTSIIRDQLKRDPK